MEYEDSQLYRSRQLLQDMTARAMGVLATPSMSLPVIRTSGDCRYNGGSWYGLEMLSFINNTKAAPLLSDICLSCSPALCTSISTASSGNFRLT